MCEHPNMDLGDSSRFLREILKRPLTEEDCLYLSKTHGSEPKSDEEHLSQDQIVGFLEETITSRELDVIEHHLGSCNACLVRCEEMLEEMSKRTEPPTNHAPHTLRFGSYAMRIVQDAHAVAAKRAKRRLLLLLSDIVARISEKYRANSAWLFLPVDTQLLKGRITHRTSFEGVKIRLTDQSVVAHVAKYRYPVCLPDVVDYPDVYRMIDPSTQSEMAVPIMNPANKGQLLGVLNLESSRRNKFHVELANELVVDAKELAMHLLCLEQTGKDKLDVWPWHPHRQGWSFRKPLSDICRELANRLDQEDRYSCSVWYADWKKEVMFALATSGYDYEFLNPAPQQMLTTESVMGDYARLPLDAIPQPCSPSNERFVKAKKAEEMGLGAVLGAPLYGANEHSMGALNMYWFGNEDSSYLPPGREMVELANFTGRIIENYHHLRIQAACAFLDAKMTESRRSCVLASPGDCRFHTLKEVFRECLDADGCSIFAPNRRGDQLLCAATTGLKFQNVTWDGQLVMVEPSEGQPLGLPPSSVSYSGNQAEHRGLIWYLYQHPQITLRLHSILCLDAEKGLPTDEQFPRQISRSHMEYLERDTVDRRFLGGSLTNRTGDVIGVVRLVRSADGIPFTVWDEILLKELANMCLQMDYWCVAPEARKLGGPRS